jgi:hypothetical protein
MPKNKKPSFCVQNLQKAKKLCHIFCSALSPALQNAHPAGCTYFCKTVPILTKQKIHHNFSRRLFAAFAHPMLGKNKGKFTTLYYFNGVQFAFTLA